MNQSTSILTTANLPLSSVISVNETAARDAVELVRELLSEYAVAFDTHRSDLLACLYLPDGTHRTATGDLLMGRVEIAHFLEVLFRRNPSLRCKMSLQSARLLTPDVLFLEAGWELGSLDEDRPSGGHALLVFARQDGEWLIAAGRSMTPAKTIR